MARAIIYEIIASKTDILLKQRNHFQTFVDETNEVLQLSYSWLRDRDITKSYTPSDINQMIEDKLAFLFSSGFSVGCEEAATEQEPVATRSFSSASKSTGQPLPAGHVHVSGVTVASDELNLGQVNVMQDAMSFLTTSSKMLSEKQLAMEQQLESFSDKYSNIEQDKLRLVEKELESINDKQINPKLLLDKITSLEKKMQDLEDSQSDIIENCHQQQMRVKDYKKENDNLKTQLLQFRQDLNDVLENVQKPKAQTSALKNKPTNDTQLNILEIRIETLEVISNDLKSKCEEHGSLLEQFTRRTDDTLKEQSTKLEKRCSSLKEFQRKTEKTVKDLTFIQDYDLIKLQNMTDKLSSLEKSWSDTSQENKKLLQDLENKLKFIQPLYV